MAKGVISGGRGKVETGSTNKNSHKPAIRKGVKTVFIEEFDITTPPNTIIMPDTNPNERRIILSGNTKISAPNKTNPIKISVIPIETRALVKCCVKVANHPILRLS